MMKDLALIFKALEKEMLHCKSEDYTARGVQSNLR